MKNKQFIISIIGLAMILIAGVFGGDKPPQAQAGTSQNVSGWAWSNMDDPATSADESTIGWISFNSNDCDTDKNGYVDTGLCGGDNSTKQAFDYGVKIDPITGNFSGYAWSENIGWIDFAPTGVTPDGTVNPAKLNLTTNQVTGWAKAVAGGTAGSGGWDGWIKMSGTATDGSPYGVSRNDCKLQGYAWGSDVVGWIHFDPINVDCQNIPPNPPVITTLPETPNQAPTVVLTAAPSTIDSGQSSALTWATANDPISCAASGDWTGSKSAGGGTESVSPIQTSTYAITCSKTGFDDVSSSATVTVNIPLSYCGDGNCDIDESCLSCESDCGSCPPPSPTFLFSPDSVSVNGQLLCGQERTYESIPIKVVPLNGFSENVSLSVGLKSGVLPQGVTSGLTDYTLTSGEYSGGFKFQITVPATVCTAINNAVFEILGNGGQSSATANVNIGSISPTFREI